MSASSSKRARAQHKAGSAERRLAEYYHRNGYVRMKDRRRAEEEGAQRYKKGDEVRLAANSAEELEEIQALLEQAGFKAGRPFRKANQFRIPIYGVDQVARFLEMAYREL